MENTIFESIKEIIHEIIVEEVEINKDTYLRDINEAKGISLGLSSIDMVDLISQIEIQYDIEINEEQIVSLRKIDDLVSLILTSTSNG